MTNNFWLSLTPELRHAAKANPTVKRGLWAHYCEAHGKSAVIAEIQRDELIKELGKFAKAIGQMCTAGIKAHEEIHKLRDIESHPISHKTKGLA